MNYCKSKHLNFYANGISRNNSERLIRQLQDNINFLREQLKNEDEIINSLLQQLSKLDNIVVQYNHSSIFETLDNRVPLPMFIEEKNSTHVRHNTTHAEILLDASITENKADDSNFNYMLLSCHVRVSE